MGKNGKNYNIGAEQLGNVCKVCGKVFNGRNWKQNLEYHFLTHTKEKPFKCPICPHRSALKYNLIRHIRNRHHDLLTSVLQNRPSERDCTEELGMLASHSNQSSSYQESEVLPALRTEISSNLEIQIPHTLGNHRSASQDVHITSDREITTTIQLNLNQESNLNSNREVCAPSNQEINIHQNRELNMALSRETNVHTNRMIDIFSSREVTNTINREMNVHNIHDVGIPLHQDTQVYSSQEIQMLSNQQSQMTLDQASQIHPK
nr:transcription factor hamlet-like [Cherax quadricarinatus]XP_053631704.1 transcription factor hamlet-like [Cherax quadricarinatus]